MLSAQHPIQESPEGIVYRRIDNAASILRAHANSGFGIGSRAIGHKAGEETPCTQCKRDEHYLGTLCKACADLAWHMAGTPAHIAAVYGDRAPVVWANALRNAAAVAVARGQGVSHAAPLSEIL